MSRESPKAVSCQSVQAAQPPHAGDLAFALAVLALGQAPDAERWPAMLIQWAQSTLSRRE